MATGDLPTQDTSVITAVSRVPQNLPATQFVFGGNGGASHGTFSLFKKATTYTLELWRSPVYKIGTKFDVLKISFPVLPAIAANMSIIPVLYFDNERVKSVGTVINSTNYTNAEKRIVLTSQNFGNTVQGRSNFFLELQMTGTALVTVGLPIQIELDVYET